MIYHGTLTSLYGTLPSPMIPVLEDAILKTKLKFYKAAEEAFNCQLSSYNQVPIVAIERSELYLSQFKCLQGLQALDAVRTPISEANERDYDVQRLITISRSIFKIKTEGDTKTALKAAKKIQKDWKAKAVGDYTDIQVECVRKYALVCIFLASSRDLITEDMKLIPTPIPPNPPTRWQGITDLRVSLVSQGRFMEALRFSTVERALCTAAGRYHNIQTMLKLGQQHQELAMKTENEIYWRAAMLRVRLDLATLLTSWKMKTEAREALSVLEKELEDTVSLFNGKSSVLRASNALDTLGIEFCKLKLLGENERTMSQFKQLLRLGEKMLAGTHIETEQCHHLAIAWAEQLYPEKQCVAVRTNIQLQTQHLFENVQGRVLDAAVNLGEILLPRFQNIKETAQNIEMIDLFEQKHGNISGTETQKFLSDLRLSLYAQRGDRVPLQHGGLGSNIGTEYRLRRHIPSKSLIEDAKFKSVIDKEHNSMLDHDQLCGYFSKPVENRVSRLLHDLVTQETMPSTLTAAALGQIFLLGGTARKVTKADFLKLNGQEMLQSLAGSADSPVSKEEWLRRGPALREWLLKDCRPNLPVRRCLWVEIHNARYVAWKHHCEASIWTQGAAERKAYPDDFIPGTSTPAISFFNDSNQLISAIEDRVELEEAKLGYMFNHYERETQLVASLLPLMYTQAFFSAYIIGGKLSVTTLSHLDRAENLAREQLAHWKSVDNHVNIAMQSINIATIAQYKLECGIITEPALVYQTLEEALGLLDEVEMLFGTTLYNLDLDHSIASLEIKMRAGSKMDIWRASSLAIRLLLSAIQFIEASKDRTEGIDDEESTTNGQESMTLRLWQWVQRSKARALAQSIGLDNIAQESLLFGIRNSISEGQIGRDDDDAGTDNDDEAPRLQTFASVPLEFLPEACKLLKGSNITFPKLHNRHLTKKTFLSDTPATPRVAATLEDITSLSQDLQSVEVLAARIKSLDEEQTEIRRKLEDRLSKLNDNINARPELCIILQIADFLNKEKELLEVIQSKTFLDLQDRLQSRINLQRLREEMKNVPLLQQLLKVREGWPLSQNDLQKMDNRRNSKVVFVDWFSTISLFNTAEKIYMILWRNGTFSLVDLHTTLNDIADPIRQFFENPDEFLPEVEPTPIKAMDLKNMVPKNRTSDLAEHRKLRSCSKLIEPLLDSTLVKPEDLLVFSVTEGFNNFPLHAINHDDHEPLIVNHPVVYVPSLSVLHRCYWSRHGKTQVPHPKKTHKALVLGGVRCRDSKYDYGMLGVQRFGALLNVPCDTFEGAAATLSNLQAYISDADLLHFHLHTNYKLLKEDAGHDAAFTESPLTQAICFTDNDLTTPNILTLQLTPGAHLNLFACASGLQGKFSHGNSPWAGRTNEAMGLVPAFLIAGSGSMTSSLWPIQDEHAAVFGGVFWKAIGAALDSHEKGYSEGVIGQSWVDIADIMRATVLTMRDMYGSPAAWAGFVLSGYWRFEK
ncbi:hypothetical protein QQS21_008673 [Conoideocrella luteorostrata]|uniref:CHAT domain-containing protein n=1 Tax=Conoideocrella luteorostrata TaxID=1105319 RepID=A0AAJ0FYH2_9HYPO|nr:hypothetical protein QQS21_008673 [Conoideocrella luteorostrata]